MTPEAASRIQSAAARDTGSESAASGFGSRAQSAGAHNSQSGAADTGGH